MRAASDEKKEKKQRIDDTPIRCWMIVSFRKTDVNSSRL
jgi:hypothetical protein